MIDRRWWERYPTVLAAEQESLRVLGIDWAADDVALKSGVMRLQLPQVDIGGERVDLTVTYPDLYPYFRLEIDAPNLSLPYHQNPFLKNLCLMGRRTENWHVGETIGTLIAKQLPKVLQAARMTTAAEAESLEEHQAEPFTDYYGCPPGAIVLIEESMEIAATRSGGSFWIGLRDPLEHPRTQLLRGALIKVEGGGDRPIEASPAIRELYDVQKLKGKWRRLGQPPVVEDPKVMMEFLQQNDREMAVLPPNEVEGGRLFIAAAVIPVERGWRLGHQDGWIFACEFVPTTKS